MYIGGEVKQFGFLLVQSISTKYSDCVWERLINYTRLLTRVVLRIRFVSREHETLEHLRGRSAELWPQDGCLRNSHPRQSYFRDASGR